MNTSKPLPPLFKWAGGKNRMIKLYGNDLHPSRPYTRFIDAFSGALAITATIHHKNPQAHLIINDANSELIHLYTTIRDNTDDLLAEATTLATPYLQLPPLKALRQPIRQQIKYDYISDDSQTVLTAARLLVLLRTSFNGLWKTYNYSRGRYATPMGTGTERNIVDEPLIRCWAQLFKQATITNLDYRDLLPYANSDTYYYADPPYRLGTTGSITYNQPFGDKQQLQLLTLMDTLTERGSLTAQSNRELGDGWWQEHAAHYNHHYYNTTYTAGRGDTTITAQEILITNWR